MYISNNAINLPLCTIRVEICLYIIIALSLPFLLLPCDCHPLFYPPSSLFLTWCSYIKYLSKLTHRVLPAFLWRLHLYLGGSNGEKLRVGCSKPYPSSWCCY